jgi:hypothetical protein
VRRLLGRAGPKGLGGPAAAAGLVFFFPFSFSNPNLFPNKFKLQTTIEFKPGFESINQKPCTSMYATVNSYISLIN